MYAKVFQQIYDSSIVENPETRFTFMDFLILADPNGVVDMTHEAIARRTNRPIELIRITITELEGPDPRSRTPDANGARILRLDGHRDWGWVIVNYEYFRKLASEEQRREKTLLRVRKHRVTHCNAAVTHANANNAMQKKRKRDKKKQIEEENKNPALGTSADDIYDAYPLKKGKPDALRAIKRAISRGTTSAVLLERTLAFADARNGDLSFCPNPATWFNQERFNDEPDTWMPQREGKEPMGRSEPSEFQQRDSKINELNRRKQAMLREYGDKVYEMREFEQIEKQLMSL